MLKCRLKKWITEVFSFVISNLFDWRELYSCCWVSFANYWSMYIIDIMEITMRYSPYLVLFYILKTYVFIFDFHKFQSRYETKNTSFHRSKILALDIHFQVEIIYIFKKKYTFNVWQRIYSVIYFKYNIINNKMY